MEHKYKFLLLIILGTIKCHVTNIILLVKNNYSEPLFIETDRSQTI